ncbi:MULTISPECIES: c-type cytochrome [Burkholderiales]|jgi:cytochrome c551/c552|uniref:c-type cytochrome n=1 Tax=Burkholderiales TaxID=80840 RepID=UPI0007007934|nr:MULTISPECIES: c-type cytochrome [Burkholderiales]AMM24020.1 cytochrome C552 [Variovorax sp. PAMC 28711]KQM71099.1 cytochrome C552 [Xylophilus sp. Leaf220]
MKTTTFLARAVLGCCVLIAFNALAAPPDIKLQPDTSKLRPSKLPGYAIAMQKCAICHSADYVNYQPPGMTQTQWTAEMAKMQHTYGAPISDDEVKQLGAYLAVAYGSAKATDASVIAASTPASAPPAPPTSPGAAAAPPAGGGSVNVQALLASNACLSCHGLTQKIVGPGYHDIAEKYKADQQAQSKLEASIRGGSVGKWGSVPMPPFAALKPEEVKALAAFVLKQ